MSLHGHQYWDGFSDSGQMALAPLLSWLNNFPGDISATGVIPVWGVCESSSFCSRCPSSHSKAQLTASIYKSSLDGLLWTPSTPIPSPPHIPHWAASCFVFLYLSPSCPSFLQRALYLYCPGSLAIYTMLKPFTTTWYTFEHFISH